MDKSQQQSRKQDGKKGTQIIVVNDSDGDNDMSRAPVRDRASSEKQNRFESGSQPKSSQSQTKNRPIGSIPLNTATRNDSKDSPLGSQQFHAQSQRQTANSTPPQNNSTLAQRVARRDPETHDRSSGRRPPHSISSSNSVTDSPPVSQVQISRGLSKASSTVPGGPKLSNASPGSSGKASRTKRSLERDGEIEESPGGKRLKSSHWQSQSLKQPTTARRPNTVSGIHNSSGPGNDGNPIFISDSPPPKETTNRRSGDSSLTDGQRTPMRSRTLASKGAGRTSAAYVPKQKATGLNNQIDCQRETVGDVSSRPEKSPTIPESLAGSPARNRASTDADRQGPPFPLFIRPSDGSIGKSLDADTEMISGFAEQAEALLASQLDGEPAAIATSRPEQPGDYQTMPRSSLSSPNPSSRAAAQSNRKGMSAAATHEASKRVDVSIHNHIKAVVLSAGRPKAGNVPSAMSSKATPANHIENVVAGYNEELRSDNVYWTRTWLKEARHAATETKWSGHAPTSVFRDMQPIEQVPASEEKRTSDLFARFTVERMHGGGKSSRRSYALPCTMYHTPTDADVPNYSYFVNIKNSFLARNETVMQHWPYFSDEFDMRGALELDQHYFLDVIARERKIKRLAQAENYAGYAEDILRDVDCAWSDVLRFLLDPKPDVGTSADALAALQSRDKFCDEDFVRGGKRWKTVLSKLPPSNDPDRVGRAALLCEYFKRIAKLQLWHVARRSAYTTRLLEESDPTLGLSELTCRVCLRFSCPYHGEMHENASGDSGSERDGSADEDVVETDIIHPYRVNYRSRVAPPPTVDPDEPGSQVDPRRKRLEYWHKLNLNHYPDDRRGPFYPCYHPGTTCEKTQCSCYENRVPCEKSCACNSSCKRKWQGCECRMKGGRICFEDARCACFQNGRECDADLCGDCGVSDVLDPVHRHDEKILQGRCSNASIQRGVPRHTILGDSGIHGLGLYACEFIKQHDFVGEYKGEIITKEEAERRGAVYEHQKLSYLFSLNNKQEVDSTQFGNKVRFINHAPEKQANLYPRIIMVNSIFRIALYGARPIKAGQELLFDYGPQFPQDQLGVSGNKASKERKAAPHVRNKNLVAQFDEIVESFDKFGNRRARKAAAGDKRGILGSKGSGAFSRGGDAVSKRSLVARKSAALPSSSRRGGPHPDATRPPRDRPTGLENTEEAQTKFDGMGLDAGHRLSSSNVAYDDFPIPVQPDDDEDDDFAPADERSSDDQGFEESSSVNGDGEDDDSEAPILTRPRSSRRRR